MIFFLHEIKHDGTTSLHGIHAQRFVLCFVDHALAWDGTMMAMFWRSSTKNLESYSYGMPTVCAVPNWIVDSGIKSYIWFAYNFVNTGVELEEMSESNHGNPDYLRILLV